MTQKHAVITDEMLFKARSRIGLIMRPREPFYNTEATRDSIRHFAHGIGDPNPLWLDEGYARNTRYGSIIAPPCFLYSVYWPCGGMVGMPGIHAWHSGNEWEWYRPIRLSDRFTVTEKIIDIVEKPSKMAGRIFIAYSMVIYYNQRDEVTAKAKGWSSWAERKASGEKAKYGDISKSYYTQEELIAIDEQILSEEIRGADPRYWEDVEVGQELKPVVKGPLSLRDIISVLMGMGSPFMRAHGFEVRMRKRHPAIAMYDSTTGQMDVPELVHMEDTRAKEIGLTGAFDYGPQRVTWLGHLLTNWIGDEGFLKRLYAELRLFNVIGDTTWCKGRVSKKYIENDEYLVDIECWGENQRGQITMPGRATVSLPSKSVNI